MKWFNLLSDLPAVDTGLVEAVVAVSGVPDVAVYAQPDWLLDEPTPPRYRAAPINIGWRHHGGAFGLELEIGGATIPGEPTTVRFTRALARAVGRPFLFGDCSSYPYSYFMAEPDGAVRHVWLEPKEPTIDLDPDVIEWPLIVAADAPLPAPAGPLPEDGRLLGCEAGPPFLRCYSFWTDSCPRRDGTRPVYRDDAGAR